MPGRLTKVLPTLLAVAALAALGFVVIVALTWLGQERMVFQPPVAAMGAGTDARRLEFAADDGTRLFAYLVGDASAARGDAGLVIHFHGNAEIAAWAVPWAQELAQRSGAAVVLAEYRGYAGIAGSPGYRASIDDARALWRMAQAELHAAPGRTTIHGFSLGSAIATDLAASIVPRALVLEAPFTSAEAMASRIGPWLRGPLWRLIARVHYDTRAHVARLDTPVWVAHGEADVVIPARMGREVFAAAAQQGAMLTVPGAGHNDLHGTPEYWPWLLRAVAAR